MNAARMQSLLRQAIDEGLLRPEAGWPERESRPWALALMTALGAWLAAVPLLGLMGLLLWDLSRSSGALFVAGAVVVALAVALLRRSAQSQFLEQAAVPLLLGGGMAMGVATFDNFPCQGAAALHALVTLLVAAWLPQAWLRALMGAIAVPLVAVALMPDDALRFGFDDARSALWLAWHLTLLGWVGALELQRQLLEAQEHARWAAVLEPVAAGWLLATLCGLAAWSGMTMFLGAHVHGWRGDRLLGAEGPSQGLSLLSTLLVLVAAARLASDWPSLRRPWCVALGLVPVVLAWFLPALGAVLLALAWCASTHRWRLAVVAALAAAWIVGSFYYRLEWPLAHKALVLVGAGVLLAVLSRWAPRGAVAQSEVPGAPARAGAAAMPPSRQRERWAQAGVALTAVAALAMVNVGIWQKEKLIADGAPLFVELMPSDPRSLLQGDYMTLNLAVRLDALPGLDDALGDARPAVVARRDERGIVALQRLDDGKPLAPGELRIQLTPKNGRWVIVTDAWFFKEGEAERWAPARYGEFRVDARGRALLVGLRDAALKPL